VVVVLRERGGGEPQSRSPGIGQSWPVRGVDARRVAPLRSHLRQRALETHVAADSMRGVGCRTRHAARAAGGFPISFENAR
jgi:hypothetical protein